MPSYTGAGSSGVMNYGAPGTNMPTMPSPGAAAPGTNMPTMPSPGGGGWGNDPGVDRNIGALMGSGIGSAGWGGPPAGSMIQDGPRSSLGLRGPGGGGNPMSAIGQFNPMSVQVPQALLNEWNINGPRTVGSFFPGGLNTNPLGMGFGPLGGGMPRPMGMTMPIGGFGGGGGFGGNGFGAGGPPQPVSGFGGGFGGGGGLLGGFQPRIMTGGTFPSGRFGIG